METPQEIEVWFIIPALRRELSKALVAKGLKQKEVAHLLGIKESAVSQYLSNKRGGDLKFKEGQLAEIKKSAENILKEPKKVMFELQRLIQCMRNCGLTCDVHREKDPDLHDCEACM